LGPDHPRANRQPP